jgi:uncharacterized protein
MEAINLMLIADVHSPDYFRMAKLEKGEMDLVLTLGDIDPGTIDYILLQASASEVFGIYGNHDPRKIEGLDILDGRVMKRNGFRVSGISGTKRQPGRYQPYQHTQTEGEVRKTLDRIGYVDVLVSHAPPYSVSKNEDWLHQGFEALDEYIARYSPMAVIYGHLGRKMRTESGKTILMCVVEKDYLRLEK